MRRKGLLLGLFVIIIFMLNSCFNIEDVLPEMVLVRAGRFQMGNTRDDIEGEDNEKPVHTVTLTYNYYIGKYEITFAEYDAYCKVTGDTKPEPFSWGWKRPKKLPVINVSWRDAISYCNWLSEQVGLKPAYDSNGNLLTSTGQVTRDITQVEGYRLPTEAEWEYAARGGHEDIKDGVEANDYKYAGSNDRDEVVCSGFPHAVWQKAPNELGLYNMSGNVFEKCHDYWASDYYTEGDKINPIGPENSSYRVTRGGNASYTCRIAWRHSTDMDEGYRNSGFRIAKTQK